MPTFTNLAGSPLPGVVGTVQNLQTTLNAQGAPNAQGTNSSSPTAKRNAINERGWYIKDNQLTQPVVDTATLDSNDPVV